jgi:hypothetical protein
VSDVPSGRDDVVAKVIQFYVRDLFPKNVKSSPRGRRAKVIEFPKEKSALGAKTRKVRGFDDAGPIAAFGLDVSNLTV